MNISNHLSFKGKFVANKAFREVVDYAEKTNQLVELDSALNRIKNIECDDILLIHGKTDKGVFSNFNAGRRAIQNLGAETPAEASFKAIVELGELGRKFRRLVGGNLKSNLTTNNVIDNYTVK